MSKCPNCGGDHSESLSGAAIATIMAVAELAGIDPVALGKKVVSDDSVDFLVKVTESIMKAGLEKMLNKDKKGKDADNNK